MPQGKTGLLGMLDAAAYSRTQNDHVTHCAEVAFERYPDAANLKYIRGSSGFAGYARSGFDRERAEAFSLQLKSLIGDRWLEWGSEQVMSNFAVANSPDPVVLPNEFYACFDPLDMPAVATGKCFHFYGTVRHSRGCYEALSRQVIGELSRAG
jgi:hypothetical protein